MLLLPCNSLAMGNNPSVAPQQKIIRIAVSKGSSQLKLTLKGYYEIYALETNTRILSGNDLKNALILPTGSGLNINGEEYKVFGIKILTQKDAAIYLNNRRFRGTMDIIRDSNVKLLAVNHIDIEDYLFGVLQYEVSFWWPYAALEAQAIAARTYALYEASKNKNKDYDLTNDTFSQMYGGAGKERYRTKKAVMNTRSKVLTYKGKIFPAYYHATCGGYTEDAAELWNIDLPVLKGVKCDFCKSSPHYYWESEMELSDIEKKLKQKGYAVSEITDIAPLDFTNNKKIRNLRIVCKEGSVEIRANKFRLLAGSRYVRSTNFKVEIKDGKAFFKGYGWGHGVGLCQWGAYFMAKKHFSAEKILKHYYSGAEIKDYFSLNNDNETE